MRCGRKKLIFLVVIFITFSLLPFGIPNQSLPARAAVPFTKYSGELTLENGLVNELYVTNAWVIKNGPSDYEMWYTHGKTDQDLYGILEGVGALVSQEIFDAIANLDLEALLSNLAGLDTTTIWNLVGNSTAVIGYATSGDGVNWTVENDEVTGLSLGSAVWDGIGAPCVIKDGGSYQMWYTHGKTNLTQEQFEDLLSDLVNSETRKAAILALVDSTSSVIGYATSGDGVTWAPGPDDIVSVSGVGIWSSVATPSVIKNSATDYQMWFTNAATDLTEVDLDAILADLPGFDINDLIDLLNDTSSVIGYTTSNNGTIWSTPTTVLSGDSGGVWDSVATPSVVKTASDNYEMWYTRVETDLTPTDIQALFDELVALEPDMSDLRATFDPDNLTPFLEDLNTFIGDPTADPVVPGDIDEIKDILANSGTVIAYATSINGTSWKVVQETSLGPIGPGPWGSVAAPCVVYDSGTYEMWYSKGTDNLTAQYLLNLLQGDTLPIGYATGFNLVAETTIAMIEDTDNIVAITPIIVRGMDSYTGLDADIPGGVSGYSGQVTVDLPGGVSFIEGRDVDPFTGLYFDPFTGEFSVMNVSSPPQPSQTPVAAIVAILTGDCLTQYELTVSFNEIFAASPPEMIVYEEVPSTIVFQRGDTTGEGEIGVGDALFILQYLIGDRTINEINAINAASIAHDGVGGDRIGVGDALFILQYLIGDRDANFDAIP